MSIYDQLIPETVIEAPYEISMLLLYDANFNLIWDWGCKGSDCNDQNIDNAQVIMSEVTKNSQGAYFQWDRTKEFMIEEEQIFEGQPTASYEIQSDMG